MNIGSLEIVSFNSIHALNQRDKDLLLSDPEVENIKRLVVQQLSNYITYITLGHVKETYRL